MPDDSVIVRLLKERLGAKKPILSEKEKNLLVEDLIKNTPKKPDYITSGKMDTNPPGLFYHFPPEAKVNLSEEDDRKNTNPNKLYRVGEDN